MSFRIPEDRVRIILNEVSKENLGVWRGSPVENRSVNWVNGILDEWIMGENKNLIILTHYSNIPSFLYSVSLSLLETSAVTWQTLSARGMGREAVPQLGVMIAL